MTVYSYYKKLLCSVVSSISSHFISIKLYCCLYQLGHYLKDYLELMCSRCCKRCDN